MHPVNSLTPERLNFAVVDGLAFAATRGRLNSLRSLATTTASDLGPFLELCQLGSDGLLPKPEHSSWLALDGVRTFYEALLSNRQQWVSPASGRSGLFRTTALHSADEAPWIGFGMQAQRAAMSAGFKRAPAQQIVGALGELRDNIYEHSAKPASGLVAFKANSGVFEFVVCDQGIGVLESLRTCEEHKSVKDYGTALTLTLTDGVSRFGSNANHGKGFRPLFLGLANMWGALRFRSGDHALTVDGQSPSLTTARTAEKPNLRGFFASVSCRVNGIETLRP